MTRDIDLQRIAHPDDFGIRSENWPDRLSGRIRAAWKAIRGILRGNTPLVGHLNGSPVSIPRAAREELIRSEFCRARGDVRESAWHLRKAIEIHPCCPEALNRLGIYWLEEGQDDLAHCYFRLAAEIEAAADKFW